MWIVAQRLQSDYEIAPYSIIACAMVSPDYLGVLDKFRLTSKKEIIKFLKENRHVTDKILGSDYFERLYPAIETDFQIFYSLCDDKEIFKPLNTSLLTLTGAEDKLIPEEGVREWGKYAITVKQISFSGDHYFLYKKENIPEVCRSIDDFINELR